MTDNGNIGIYRLCVFHVRSESKKLYDLECDWERLSTSSMRKVKGRTFVSVKPSPLIGLD